MVTVNKKEHTKLSNQSIVFEVFGDNEKLMVTEIQERVNGKLAPDKLSGNTVRRAISELEDKGFIQSFGRHHNARLYGKPSAGIGDVKQTLIPYSGELKTVVEFVHLMTDPNSRPLTRKTAVIGEKMQHRIRRQLLFAIITAGNPGYTSKLMDVNADLHLLADDLRFALSVIQNFLDSPVWYEHYRDQIAQGVQELQKSNPELFELAINYIGSES